MITDLQDNNMTLDDLRSQIKDEKVIRENLKPKNDIMGSYKTKKFEERKSKLIQRLNSVS